MTGQKPAARRVLIVSRYDVRHPRAGDSEQYLYETGRRWAAAGTRVTWVVTRAAESPGAETIDGIQVVRAGQGPASILLAVARLVRSGSTPDVVLDADSGTGSALSFVVGRRVPVVPLAQRLPEQRRSWPRRVEAIVVLTPSARHHLRRRLRFFGSIFVVPPGAPPGAPATGRSTAPTVVVDTDIVAREQLDLLLDKLPWVVAALPGLRVDIIGDGPELARLRHRARTPEMAGSVVLHGRVSAGERDRLWRRAWLAVALGPQATHPSRLLTAAAYGIPSLMLDDPQITGVLQPGHTRYLLASPEQLPAELLRRLAELSDNGTARQVAAACRDRAARFRWERSAALLAGVLEQRISTARSGRFPRGATRSDIATLVHLAPGIAVPAGALRHTDEVITIDGRTSLLLNSCDEIDSLGVLARIGAVGAQIRVAGHEDLLTGPDPRDLTPPSLATERS